MKRITVPFPPQTVAKLRRLAEKKALPLATLIRLLVVERLEEGGGKTL